MEICMGKVSWNKKRALIFVIVLVIVIITGGIIMATPIKPLVSQKEITLKYNIKNIWNVVVDNNDYEWRTDIKKLEMLDNGNSWIEYYDDGGKYFSKFTITGKDEYKKYSFDMDNKNYYGNWTGEFIEINQDETKCIFTETIYVKNKIMNLLAKLFWNLEKIQEQYFNDLKTKLENME
jgi:hypothetical protein